MVDFNLSESEKQVRAGARMVAAQVLKGANAVYGRLPTQVERFRSTRSLFRKAVELGQIRALVPPNLGGTGGTTMDVAIAIEELYLIDPSLTITIVGSGLGLTPLLLSGKEDLQHKFLKPFLSGEGEPLASLMHSEPTGTANWLEKGGKGLQVTARKEGDEWLVNGEKVRNATNAKLRLTI